MRSVFQHIPSMFLHPIRFVPTTEGRLDFPWPIRQKTRTRPVGAEKTPVGTIRWTCLCLTRLWAGPPSFYLSQPWSPLYAQSIPCPRVIELQPYSSQGRSADWASRLLSLFSLKPSAPQQTPPRRMESPTEFSASSDNLTLLLSAPLTSEVTVVTSDSHNILVNATGYYS